MEEEKHHLEHREHEHHAKKDHVKMKKSSLWMIISGVLAVLLVVSYYTNGFKGSGGAGGKTLSAQEAADKAVTYINTNLLQPGTTAKAGEVKEVNNLYNVKLDVGGREYDSYVTKDGGLLFPSVVNLDQKIEEPTAEPTTEEQTKSAEQKCKEMKKVDKPKLEVFYVSRCPFGVQAINALYYVAKNFGNKAEVIPRLLVNKAADGKSTTSMHGEEEHKEDLRQICLREEQKSVYWDYINCYAESGDSAVCEKTAKVDSAKLADCAEKRAEGYALKDADDWEKIYQPKGGSGSPSFFLNGEKINEYDFSQNGRAPDNIKTIICCSAKGEIAECDNTLQTSQPPRGFGKIEGVATDSSGQQLNCG